MWNKVPLHLVCPWRGAQPSLASSPPPAPQPPHYSSATAGSTPGQRDSRLREPHFPHWGWVALTGGRPPPDQVLPVPQGSDPPEAPGPPQSFSSAKSFGVSLLLTSISLLLAGSTPRFHDPDLIAHFQGAAYSQVEDVRLVLPDSIFFFFPLKWNLEFSGKSPGY